MKRVVILLIAASVLLTGCQSLRRLGLAVEQPTARVESVSLSELTFDRAELTAELAVDNPNAIGITLSGFAYTLEIEGREFLSGEQQRGVRIAPFDEGALRLPLSIRFQELLDTYEAVRSRDEAAYAVGIDLQFDLPALGAVTVPVRREGIFPIVRAPTVRVAELRVDSLGITGARLALTVRVDNPNAFALTLGSLDYAFAVQERVWIDGSIDRPRTIPAEGSGEITGEFSLSFAAFGRTVRDLLLGDEAIEYSFLANATIDPALELIPTVSLPFNRQGRVQVRRP
jgi:LEA14-like dessication related protein